MDLDKEEIRTLHSKITQYHAYLINCENIAKMTFEVSPNPVSEANLHMIHSNVNAYEAMFIKEEKK